VTSPLPPSRRLAPCLTPARQPVGCGPEGGGQPLRPRSPPSAPPALPLRCILHGGPALFLLLFLRFLCLAVGLLVRALFAAQRRSSYVPVMHQRRRWRLDPHRLRLPRSGRRRGRPSCPFSARDPHSAGWWWPAWRGAWSVRAARSSIFYEFTALASCRLALSARGSLLSRSFPQIPDTEGSDEDEG